ncbi:MAG TPA: DNA-directed RNA polymerase subunit D [Chromatiaceae bacterium]|nr:DNA-directed RNA polymerase subunit D [Chromatiaceae bacterium]
MAMNLKILEKSSTHLKILFENVPYPILNALRRISMSEVPTMAIDEVLFIDNTSAIYDEILAHRIGLIPLRSDIALEKYLSPDICAKCTEPEPPPELRELCRKCFVHLSLDVRSDNNVVTIYSKDLKSDDPDVIPVSGEIPIAVLGPNQRIAFEARARLGKGKEHIKWSPVTVISTTYVAKITIDNESCTLCGECTKVCPEKILKIENNKLIVTNELKCSLCRQCVKVCKPEAIEISHYDNKHILFLESSGALKPERIIFEALKIILNKINKLQSKLKSLGVIS